MMTIKRTSLLDLASREVVFSLPHIHVGIRPAPVHFNPVIITGIMADPPGDDVAPQAGEYVVLENLSHTEIKLSGWRIRSEDSSLALGDRSRGAAGRVGKASTGRSKKEPQKKQQPMLVLPIGTSIMPSRKLRVHTGPGKRTTDDVFCHKRKAIWANIRGTAHFADSSGKPLQTFHYTRKS